MNPGLADAGDYLAVPESGAARGRSLARRYARTLSARAFGNALAIGCTDATMIALALVLAGAIRIEIAGVSALPPLALVFIPVWTLASCFGGLLPGWGLSSVDHFRRQVTLLTGLFGFATILLFVTKSSESVSRLSVIMTWALAITLVPLGRTFARGLLCRLRLYGTATIVYGRAAAAEEIVERLQAESGMGYIPVGVCTDDDVEAIRGIPVVGRLDRINPSAPTAIIASGRLSHGASRKLIKHVLGYYQNVLILPDLGSVPSLSVSPRDLGGIIGLEISQALLGPFASKAKRAFDLGLALSTSVLWLPLCAVVCIAIWIEDGKNPLYRQPRVGRFGRAFYTYKFRTMVTDADQILERYLKENPAVREEWETHCKLRNDPRITRVGRVLRRTSFDEIPQLLNVIAGDMALVGPRPLPAYHVRKLPAAVRSLRAHVRPGITGLWQVSGRSDAGNEGMVRWDPYYVRNWSLWLDTVIAVRTIRVVLFGSGAR